MKINQKYQEKQKMSFVYLDTTLNQLNFNEEDKKQIKELMKIDYQNKKENLFEDLS